MQWRHTRTELIQKSPFTKSFLKGIDLCFSGNLQTSSIIMSQIITGHNFKLLQLNIRIGLLEKYSELQLNMELYFDAKITSE